MTGVIDERDLATGAALRAIRAALSFAAGIPGTLHERIERLVHGLALQVDVGGDIEVQLAQGRCHEAGVGRGETQQCGRVAGVADD